MMAWRIDGCASTGDLDIFAVDETLGDYRVAMIECDDNTVDEQTVMANARLIAAAPRMYAALERLVYDYEHFAKTNDGFVAEVGKLLQEIDG
jgi:hypothetical protein